MQHLFLPKLAEHIHAFQHVKTRAVEPVHKFQAPAPLSKKFLATAPANCLDSGSTALVKTIEVKAVVSRVLFAM